MKKDYLSIAVNVVTLIGAAVSALFWADNNLASKNDIDVAKKLGEFRIIELQLSFNDYRISEMEKMGKVEDFNNETNRVYKQIINNSTRLNVRRDELLTGGVLE